MLGVVHLPPILFYIYLKQNNETYKNYNILIIACRNSL